MRVLVLPLLRLTRMAREVEGPSPVIGILDDAQPDSVVQAPPETPFQVAVPDVIVAPFAAPKGSDAAARRRK
jgi:hypothetical protein